MSENASPAGPPAAADLTAVLKDFSNILDACAAAYTGPVSKQVSRGSGHAMLAWRSPSARFPLPHLAASMCNPRALLMDFVDSHLPGHPG